MSYPRGKSKVSRRKQLTLRAHRAASDVLFRMNADLTFLLVKLNEHFNTSDRRIRHVRKALDQVNHLRALLEDTLCRQRLPNAEGVEYFRPGYYPSAILKEGFAEERVLYIDQDTNDVNIRTEDDPLFEPGVRVVISPKVVSGNSERFMKMFSRPIKGPLTWTINPNLKDSPLLS